MSHDTVPKNFEDETHVELKRKRFGLGFLTGFDFFLHETKDRSRDFISQLGIKFLDLE
jgi:hypothetical protein